MITYNQYMFKRKRMRAKAMLARLREYKLPIYRARTIAAEYVKGEIDYGEALDLINKLEKLYMMRKMGRKR